MTKWKVTHINRKIRIIEADEWREEDGWCLFTKIKKFKSWFKPDEDVLVIAIKSNLIEEIE